MRMKEVLQQKIEEHRPRTVRLLKEYGDVEISKVTIAQAIGGARGVRCLVTDVSYLDPFEGIRVGQAHLGIPVRHHFSPSNSTSGSSSSSS